ncbi:MAG: SENSORY BOX/GGDEF FAMILY PROTEIN [uncultured Lysobacter sp.]|uniref:diguanylate cyclase n=1 Tax=uncultured Lysobacter sp. TaxID=271060 RepID=A0A6J4KRY6_9GAMM|nr:MAG: SENSORY BOX/GGDEF FAMILY PROTEIN [uncultured Lysobacter sp.]
MLHLDNPDVLSATGPSRYRRAFERGYRGLRFERPLERDFRRFNDSMNLMRVRWATYLAFALFGAFVVIDLATLPADVARWTAGIRLGLIMPAFAIVLLTSHSFVWRRYLQRSIFVASLITGLGTVAVVGAALLRGYALPYEGLLLVVLFIYLIACLSWWRALIVNITTLIAFVAMEFALQPDPQARLYQIIFMCTANAVGAYGGYFIEYGSRTAFLMQGMLNDLAERDSMTGLYNRRVLNSHLDRTWRQASREGAELAVAMIDVDQFKRYNDRYGHAQGDTALRAVAGVIAQQARRPMDLAARYGGEEFALIWYRMQAEDLPALGEQLREAVEALAVEHAGSSHRVLTVSVGIALMAPAAFQSSADLLRAADNALYQAKQDGRNRVKLLVHPKLSDIVA